MLVHVKLSVLARMLAPHLRYPGGRLPAQGEYSDQDDPDKKTGNLRRPRPERHNGDPGVGILFQKENGEAKNEAVKEFSHGLIINRRKSFCGRDSRQSQVKYKVPHAWRSKRLSAL